jgi:hypothetical protein
VTIGMNLRNILSGAILAATMAVACWVVSDGAQAKNSASAGNTYVCNTASGNGGGGELIVPDGFDPQGAHKNSAGLRAKKSGNYNAASHSRALALCTVPAEDGPTGGEGVTDPPVTGGGLSGGDNG